jgi:hypothetical protein
MGPVRNWMTSGFGFVAMSVWSYLSLAGRKV